MTRKIAPTSTVKPRANDCNAPDISWISKLPRYSRAEVKALALQIAATRKLSASDIAGLTKYGETLNDIRAARVFAGEAEESGDALAWRAMTQTVGLLQNVLRGIRRDLHLNGGLEDKRAPGSSLDKASRRHGDSSAWPPGVLDVDPATVSGWAKN